MRIKGDKDYYGFGKNIKIALEEYITCCPIPVTFNGDIVGVDFTKTLSNAFSEPRVYMFSSNEIKILETELDIKIGSKVGFEIIPVNLTEDSVNPNLKGQLCILRLIYEEEAFSSLNLSWEFNLPVKNNKAIVFKYTYNEVQSNRERSRTSSIDITKIFDESFSNSNLEDLFHSENDDHYEINGVIKLIHNGINVPNVNRNRYSPSLVFKHCFSENEYYYNHRDRKNHAAFGIIYLQDNLIPELTISRNAIKDINFSIYSSLYFASKHLNQYVSEDFYFNYFENATPFFSLNDVLKDELVLNGYWDKIKLINTNEGKMSIEELKQNFKMHPIEVSYPKRKSFLGSLIATLLYKNFDLRYIFNEAENAYYLSIVNLQNIKQEVFEIGERRPLLFVEFDTDILICHGGYFNKKHRIIIWVLSNEIELFKTFRQYLIQLLHYILEKNVLAANNVLSHLRKSSFLNVPVMNIDEKDFESSAQDPY